MLLARTKILRNILHNKSKHSNLRVSKRSAVALKVNFIDAVELYALLRTLTDTLYDLQVPDMRVYPVGVRDIRPEGGRAGDITTMRTRVDRYDR